MSGIISKCAIVASVALTFGLVACSNDDDNSGSIDINNPNIGETPTTPAEEKAFIEETAAQLQTIIKPEDQKEFVNFCKDFAEEFDAFINNEDYPGYYAADGIKNLGIAVSNCNPLAISRAVQEISYSFSDISGIYEPDFTNNDWNKTGDSKNLEYRFSVKGQKCSLTIAPSNGEWNGSVSGYYEEDEYPYDEYPVIYRIAVPRSVKITLTEGSKTLINGTVNTDYNQSGMTASSDVDVTVANIVVKAKADLNNSRCIANATLAIGGTMIAEANGVLNGHDLCNLDRLMQIWEASESDNDDRDEESWINNPNNIHSLFSNASASTNILSRIFVSGSCDNMARMAYIFDNWYDVEENKNEAQKQVNTINDHIKAQFYLGGAKDPSGNFIWQLQREYEDWGSGSYEYWYAEPVMKFASDNTTYRVTDYFNEDDFATTIDVFVGIADLYKTFFGF